MRTFEELYREHVQSVFRFAMRMTGNRKRPKISHPRRSWRSIAILASIDTSPALSWGWLLTVVRNRARDGWRHQVIEERHREALRSAPSSAPPALEQWILEDAGLKPVHRACVMLRYVHGMTRAEIAAATGLNEMQVKGHLHMRCRCCAPGTGVYER